MVVRPKTGMKIPEGSLFRFAELLNGIRKPMGAQSLKANSLDSLQGSLPRDRFCEFRAEKAAFSGYCEFLPVLLPVLPRGNMARGAGGPPMRLSHRRR